MSLTPSVDRIGHVVSRVGDLPPLPEAAARAIELAANPNVNNGVLEMAISRDPALTAKILKLSNSPVFGVRGEVTTLSHAIALLGLNKLRSAVVAAASESLLRTKKSGLQERILWEHALAVGIAARLIAYQARHAVAEEAFVAGLLHDIGKAVLAENFGDRYQPVVERVYNEGSTFLASEDEILGLNHAEVGAAVVERWGLAPQLVDTVLHHHDPVRASLDRDLCSVVSLANGLCVKAGFGPEKNPDLDLASLDAVAVLGIRTDQLESVIEALSERLQEEKAALGLT